VRKTGSQSVERALRLLSGIIADGGASSLGTIAAAQGLAPATAYRLAATLVRETMLLPVGRGRHLPGPALVALSASLSLRPALVALGRPAVKALARATGCTAHLGILEHDMVTYLVKAGRPLATVFTEEGKQLEAYCSGIGKVLLASLPAEQRAEYLAGGPFVALTDKTITDPDLLAQEIARVGARNFARDTEEVAPGLHCLAVGVRDPDGRAIAALSISRPEPHADEAQALAALVNAARQLESALFGAACDMSLR
jgi:IclR family acetate operon transcriptional repressor